jgi:hypothetical protein
VEQALVALGSKRMPESKDPSASAVSDQTKNFYDAVDWTVTGDAQKWEDLRPCAPGKFESHGGLVAGTVASEWVAYDDVCGVWNHFTNVQSICLPG